MGYRSFAEIERDNQDIYEESLANESERLSKLVGKEIDVTKSESDGYDEGYEITFMYRNHEYSIEFLYGMPAGYNDRKFVELINEIDKELEEELKDMYSPKKALNNIRYHYFNGDREHNVIETERFWFERVEKELKDYESRKVFLENVDNNVIVFEPKEVWEDKLKKLKALEIIKETPIFAWYVTIYKDAYEMVSDVKGFRVNNSVEELQEMFDLLKEVLG